MNKTPKEIRRDLVSAHKQLTQRLGRIREDEDHRRAPLSPDSSDRAQEQENDEVLVRLDAATQDLLAQHQHAIERIDHGQYGVCERCGFEIEARRLHAVPQATRCAACAAVPAARAA